MANLNMITISIQSSIFDITILSSSGIYYHCDHLIDAITLHIATIRQNCYTCWIRYATALVWHCNYISLWVWYRIKVSCLAYSYSLTQLDKVHIQFGWLWLRFDKIIYRCIICHSHSLISLGFWVVYISLQFDKITTHFEYGII